MQSSAFDVSMDPTQRKIQFWSTAVQIYSSYKLFQMKKSLKVKLKFSSEEKEQLELHQLHEKNSQKILNMCLNLRGFYLKTGQFLGTRHDIMPTEYITKLSQLQDAVPSLSEKEIRPILEKELNTTNLNNYFSFIDLQNPIGSASIGQVHYGIWKATKQRVAVKIQNPNAEFLITKDLSNLEQLAKFLSATKDVPMNFLTAIQEFQKQVKNEFDFKLEAFNMDKIGKELSRKVSNVLIPRSIFASRHLLVMTYIDGENLSKLARSHRAAPAITNQSDKSMSLVSAPRNSPSMVSAFFQRKFLSKISELYGHQIFSMKLFHADPHPGNICLPLPSSSSAANNKNAVTGLARGFTGSIRHIGLLDWGQVKHLSDELLLKFSRLICAIARKDRERILHSFQNLGIVVDDSVRDNPEIVEKLAMTLFDTKKSTKIQLPGGKKNDAVNVTPRSLIKTIPSDLFFIIRTMQLIRGIAHGLGIHDFSIAKEWEPHAAGYLKRIGQDQAPIYFSHKGFFRRFFDGVSSSLVSFNSTISAKEPISVFDIVDLTS
jgi:predicted unusual protein kinase regulating ubiquinone biosynthesis (AarF/ABC1/UbiB family)